jgi:hypothetical protein
MVGKLNYTFLKSEKAYWETINGQEPLDQGGEVTKAIADANEVLETPDGIIPVEDEEKQDIKNDY